MIVKKMAKFLVAVATQWLYGPEALKIVQGHMEEVLGKLNEYLSGLGINARLELYPVGATQEAFHKFFSDAEYQNDCAGVILWPHTFSPAELSIADIAKFSKAIAVLHTNFFDVIDWGKVDMNFMNLNQTAHGALEFANGCRRAGVPTIDIVGTWQEEGFKSEVAKFVRVASACHRLRSLKVICFSGKMRYVAGTGVDTTQFLKDFGVTILPFSINDLVDAVNNVKEDAAFWEKITELENNYVVADSLGKGGNKRQSLIDAVRIYFGLKEFLDKHGAEAFTTNFEALGSLKQLPGLAVQLLGQEGYGFAAEGDVKTAALVWLMKQIAPRTTFMEHYISDHSGNLMLGAHMLETDPSVSAGVVRIEVHPLGIGGKEDPVRMVFKSGTYEAVNVDIVNLGGRYRFIASKVDLIPGPETEILPVARVFWRPKAGLKTETLCWMKAGGTHHTALSIGVSLEEIMMISDILGVELLTIDKGMDVVSFQQNLRMIEMYYGLKQMARGLTV